MTIHQRGAVNASAECLRSVVKRPLTFELRFGRADAICAATHAEEAAQARRAGGKMNAGWTVLTDAMWRGSSPCCPARRPIPASPRRTAGSFRDGALAVPHGIALARPSAALRQPEQRVQEVPPLGDFNRVFNALSEEFDLDHVFADGTIVQAHQMASGARGDRNAGDPDTPWAA